MDISRIDKNFNNYFSIEGLTTYSVNDEPIKLYGLCREKGETDFKRLPHKIAKQIPNQSVNVLYKNTSGIRVRFKTDSKRIVIKCVLPEINTFPHMPLTGSSCFDLYADGNYCNVFRPGIDIKGEYSDNAAEENGYSSGYTFSENKMREVLIHFPLYNDVSELHIAFENNAQILSPGEYANKKPIIYYGSSITQGGCASHPGNCYPAIISRRLSYDFINLGFSAGCHAERKMADYIAGLDKSILVYDYDHNAPSVSILEETHNLFFERIREKCPILPIIIVTAADLSFGEEVREKRKAVIKQTYDKAVQNGDKNIYFVDGSKIYSEVGADYCTVDNTHPNDLGFWCMANAICEVIKKL